MCGSEDVGGSWSGVGEGWSVGTFGSSAGSEPGFDRLKKLPTSLIWEDAFMALPATKPVPAMAKLPYVGAFKKVSCHYLSQWHQKILKPTWISLTLICQRKTWQSWIRFKESKLRLILTQLIFNRKSNSSGLLFAQFFLGGSFGMFFVICITIVWLPLRRGIFSC